MNRLWLYFMICMVFGSASYAHRYNENHVGQRQYLGTKAVWRTMQVTSRAGKPQTPRGTDMGLADGRHAHTATATVTQASHRIQHIAAQGGTKMADGSKAEGFQQPASSVVPSSNNGNTTNPANGIVVQTGDWRDEMLRLLNELRISKHKNARQMHAGLNQVAQAHSEYQNSIKTMTHKDPKPLGDRVSSQGIKWSGLAENVAAGTETVAGALEAWTRSVGHYENMIGDYEFVGFGEAGHYWTQDFSSA